MKYFLFTLSGAFFLSFCWQACCPPAQPVPNPLIKFDSPNVPGFSVTYDSVANAASIILDVSDADGDSIFHVTGTPGQEQILDFPPSADIPRPLQLRFRYQSAQGTTLVEDSIRIDDRQDLGNTIPDMDIEMGVTGPSNCPSAPNLVQTFPDGDWTIFLWDTGDQFELLLRNNAGDVVEKIRLHPTPGTGGNAGKVTCYKQGNFSCLTNPTTELVSNNKLLKVTVPSVVYEIKAFDNNTGEDRRFEVKIPAGYRMSVTK